MNFASDNCAGVHPDIMAALLAANDGHVASYGHDRLTAQAHDRLRDLFEAPQAQVFLVASGTGANGLAISSLCPPWGRIFCHDTAHIETSESGGPQWMAGGAQMTLLPGPHGRILPETLAQALVGHPQQDEHDGVNAVLSLTNATEWGTVYDPARLTALTALAHQAGLSVHLDGARFANAVVATGASPADLTWRAGVDAVSFGATKNGCMALEAVIFFNPDQARDFRFRRMRAGHLWSKHRFLAAQMLAYLNDGLWLRLAGQANQMAAGLARGLVRAGHAPLAPVQANEVFVTLPRPLIARLRGAGLRAADWPQPGDDAGQGTLRLVSSWATTEAEVQAFLDAL
ncbi:threonine aldolase family protein [Paracoccus jiaweipingae]|uniref:threonine aldolase family protein n=1 Tax=unclassified Paracoccus (in: a-proteobacteria) TaxID=2688777 RepID=UPI00379171EB